MSESTPTRLVHRFKSGEIIFREGDSGDEMFIIKQGRVGIWREIDGERSTLQVLEKGDFFGEMSLLEGLPRAANAEAVEDTELMGISGSTFTAMVRDNVQIAVRIMRKLSARLRRANARIAELKAGDKRPRPREFHPDHERPPARLEVKGTGRTIPIWLEEIRIGRFDPVTGEHPDVDLSNEEMGRSVSRRHARIVERGGEFFLVGEVGSRNPTLLNGEALEPATLVPLSDGDEIGMGRLILIFHQD